MAHKNNFFAALSFPVLSTLAWTRTPSSQLGDTTYTLTQDGIEQTYVLYVPDSYDASRPTALVLDFHGGAGNASTQIRTSNFSELAEAVCFILAYPNETGRRDDSLLTWNGGACCGYAVAQQMDDVGFIRNVLADIESKYSIDPKRIYTTGFSNGGIFSYRLACDAADVFAATAPVAGT